MTLAEPVQQLVGELERPVDFGPVVSEDYKRGYQAARTDVAAFVDVAFTEALAHLDSTVAEIFRTGRAVYDANAFMTFMTSPLEEFGGKAAVDLIASGEAGRVLAALSADYEGQVR